MNQTPKSLFPWYKKVDLSDKEHWREYIFPNGERVRIESPQYLIVSDNGHRIKGGDGVCYYIPYGWLYLIFYPRKEQGFYCEENDKIDPAEDECEMPIEKTLFKEEGEPKPRLIDVPGGTKFDYSAIYEDLKKRVSETFQSSVSAFCRFLTNQVDNADRNNNTIEGQTLDRVGEKFTSLFHSWMETEDESEEEPDQCSTESTE